MGGGRAEGSVRVSKSPLHFVGRGIELGTLHDVLLGGIKGHGRSVFIEGGPGQGKTGLMRALEERTARDPELRRSRFVTVQCYKDTGEHDAYQPFAEILKAILESEGKEQKGRLKKLLAILKETAPDWLEIIPGLASVGKAVKAARKTIDLYHGSGDDRYASLTYRLDTQYASAIARMTSLYPLLVLILEDCQWIDSSSCQLLLRLTRALQDRHVVIIATYRPAEVDPEHALTGVVEEMRIEDIASVLSLSGLSQDEIEHYIQTRFNDPLSPELGPWLEHLCKGNPLIVTQYLSLLEEEKIIRREGTEFVLDGVIRFSSGKWELSDSLAKLPVPARVDAVLKRRIQLLSKEIRKTLRVAAVQGERFMSVVLSDILDEQEENILDQLGAVIERYRIIQLFSGEQWVVSRSEVYIFEHELLRQQFYRKLSRRQRLLYHRGVAESLEGLIRDQADPPRKLLLEVARHADLGGNDFLAGRLYDRAAQTTFLNGAFSETIGLCEMALDRVRRLEMGLIEHDRLRSEIIILLLFASEMWWSGRAEPPEGKLPLTELVSEAEEAATRAGDQILLARVKFLRGRILIYTGDTNDAIEAMKEALDAAERAGDSFGEFMIMSQLGHSMVMIDLNEGLDLQRQAHSFFESTLATSQRGPRRTGLQREFYQLQGRIGIGEFDRGNIGEAISWLERSVAGLEQIKMQFELAWGLNFLGQVYTSIGQFEKAEVTLRKAIDLNKDEEPSAVRGNNLADLGKLYMEWGRIEDAVGPLLEGWKETKATWMVAVVPLVRNYLIELLIQPESPVHDLTEAERHVRLTLEQAKEHSLDRSAIVSMSLWSQIALKQGRGEEALNRSSEAIAYLQKRDRVPHVREQEILFNHYLALKEAGPPREAKAYLERAGRVLEQKASSIDNEEQRNAFLSRVPNNQRILDAMRQS